MDSIDILQPTLGSMWREFNICPIKNSIWSRRNPYYCEPKYIKIKLRKKETLLIICYSNHFGRSKVEGFQTIPSIHWFKWGKFYIIQLLLKKFPAIKFPQSLNQLVDTKTILNSKKNAQAEERRKNIQQCLRDLVRIEEIKESRIMG